MAEKKKITRKVISKAKHSQIEVEVKNEAVDQPKEITKKKCIFCQTKSNPSYTDLATLRRFLTDRAKILGKARSNICSKHQRAVAKNIKYARHLSLLPFVPKV